MTNVVPLLGSYENTPEILEVLKLLGPEEKHVTESDEYYLNYYGSGTSILFRSGIVRAVFLYRDGEDGYHGWSLGLPKGLDFGMSMASVRGMIGMPSKTGEWKNRVWDRFDEESYSIHIDYSENQNQINILSLMSRSERDRIESER